MENSKVKRKSILIVCNILLTLLLLLTTAVTITLAIQQFNMNIGGNITFNATDVQATISAGQVANGSVAGEGKMQQIVLTPENNGTTEKATWENLEITFGGLDDVIISFTVTNNHTESNLKMSLTTSSIDANNMTISTKIDNSSKTSVVIPKQAEGNDNKVDCQIIFHVESNLTSANIEGFSIEYTFANTDEEPASGYEVSIDSSATSLVSSLSSTSVGESEQVTFTSTAKDTIGEEQITTQEIKITDMEGGEVPYTVSNIEDSTQYSFTMPASNVTISVESQTLTRITDFMITSNRIFSYTGTDSEVTVPSSYYPYQQETENVFKLTQTEFMTNYGLFNFLYCGHFSYKTNGSAEFIDMESAADGAAWVETAMSYSEDQFPLEIILPTEYSVTSEDIQYAVEEGLDVASFIFAPVAAIYLSNNILLSFTYQIGDNEPINVDVYNFVEYFDMVTNYIDNGVDLQQVIPIKYSNFKYGKIIPCVGEGFGIDAIQCNDLDICDNEGFSGNTNITKVKVLEGISIIGGDIFSGCTSLTEVSLPTTITVIDYRAFSNCTSLSTITIPDGVQEVGNDAFSNTALTFTEDNNGRYLASATNQYCILIDIVDTTSVTEFTVNDKCKIIYTSFSNNFTKVTIPSSVIYISSKPSSCDIYYQGTLEQWLDINFPHNSMGHSCNLFIDNKLIEEVSIDKNIKAYAFAGITSLTKVTLGENVTLIGSSAFFGCTNLTSVTIESDDIYNKAVGTNYDQTGALLANATTVKVLKTIDDGSNSYLNSNYQKDDTSDEKYNIYTK